MCDLYTVLQLTPFLSGSRDQFCVVECNNSPTHWPTYMKNPFQFLKKKCGALLLFDFLFVLFCVVVAMRFQQNIAFIWYFLLSMETRSGSHTRTQKKCQANNIIRCNSDGFVENETKTCTVLSYAIASYSTSKWHRTNWRNWHILQSRKCNQI